MVRSRSKVKEEYKPIEENIKDNPFIQIGFITDYKNIIEDHVKTLASEMYKENNLQEHTEKHSEYDQTYFEGVNEEVAKGYNLNQSTKENTEIKEVKKENKIITLESYYKKRTDYGDITSTFYKVYEREFCDYFKIKEIDDLTMPEIISNKEKMKELGIDFGFRKKDSILSDVHIESEKVDKGIEIDNQEALVDIIMSDSDLQYDFEKVIQNNLNGFAPVRSIPTVKKAIINVFGKYLGLKPQNKGILLMQNLIVNNSDIFGRIISKATDAYKSIHKYEVDQKEGYEINKEWHIPFDKNYNPNTCVEIQSKLSIHQLLYIETKAGKVDELEVSFIKYLDKHEDAIEYFWKNGSEHMNTNFGIAKEDGSTFQPDFLILFKDGRIGIFDTKAGKGFNENDNELKSNALQQYIVDENKKGKNLVGGLVVQHKDKFYYYDRSVYSSFRNKTDEWKDFEELLK